MNGLKGTTTSISIVAAIVLWSLATWLEGERAEPEIGSIEPPHAFSDEVTPDSEIRSDQVLQSCRDAEDNILQIVDASRYCSVDDDCTIFDYGYPIQCLTSIAKSQITTLRLEYRKYEQSCEYRVYYDCPAEPLRRSAVCRSNQCVVELQTNDLLKGRTLDHIGVDPGAGLAPARPNSRPN